MVFFALFANLAVNVDNKKHGAGCAVFGKTQKLKP